MPSVLSVLERRLAPLIGIERQFWQRKALVVGLLGVSLLTIGLAWLASRHAVSAAAVWLGALGGLVLAILIASVGARVRRVDVRTIARRIEREHPDLQAALLTALEQEAAEGGLSYLQERVILDAVRHANTHDWLGGPTRLRLNAWGAACVLMILVFAEAMFFSSGIIGYVKRTPIAAVKPVTPPAPAAPIPTVEVRPGDTEVERGSRLPVEARFKGGVPADVMLVLSDDAEGKVERARVAMKGTVEADAFGGLIPTVDSDGFYRVTFSGGESKTHRVTTYVHPALVRADATITPPAYSGQPVKEVKNTQNVTALEGSKIAFRMKVNKLVTAAELFGEDKTSIALTPSKSDPLTLEGAMQPDKSQKYRLHLVDAQERANKQPPWFKVTVLGDAPPKVEIVFPKRDLTVSPLQEMPLETKVWDDIAVQRAGAVFMLGAETQEVTLADKQLPGKQNHSLKTMLALEKLKAEPRQIVSYYVWAEDNHPRGGIRRTQSDMFFADVRHFEDIFREGEAPPGEGKEPKSPTDKLAQLQKQIVNATWKLVRDTGGGKKFPEIQPDMGVVKESQDLVKTQTDEVLEKAEDAEIRAALKDAVKAMQQAATTLGQGLEKEQGTAVKDALNPEIAALAALGRAQSREHQVTRSQQPSKSQTASEQQKERQVMQLELKQKEKRYEEEKEAGEEADKEQQENLQVLNRLKELARRQEALAEKIKEVEQQLAQAKSEEQREELAQQLKRLQEEQEQMLRDMDELQERMEQPENQQNMAQEREKLEAAREQVRQAAEQLAQQQAGAAANSATRAQKGIEEVRDEFRERTAKRFTQEVRQLKQEAAGLAQNEEKLSKDIEKQGEVKPGSDSAAELQQQLEQAKLTRQVEDQRAALEGLMQQMQQISEQAEQAEPLLSTALNDAARRAQAAGIDAALEEARDQMRFGANDDARAAERKAAKGIEDLQKGVEKAAEAVLGSETEALRMARNELDRLLQEVNKEAQVKNASGEPDPKTAQAGKSANSGKGTPAENEGKPVDGDGAKPVAANDGSGDAKAQDKPSPGTSPSSEGKSGKGGTPGEPKQKEQGLAGNSPSSQGGQTAPGESAEKPSRSPTEGKGQGQGQGQTPSPEGKGSESQTAANGGTQPGSSPGQQGAPGSPEAQGQTPSPGGQRGAVAQGGGNAGGGSSRQGGDDRRRSLTPGGGGEGWFFDQPEVAQNDSPLTGANYEEWTDRLRRVEEALNAPDLRNDAARVMDNARQMRADWRRNNLPPQADAIRMTIVQPLAELRDRVTEELAKREAKNPLSPLDRDPVPARYRELVRRYYSELGGGG